MSRTVTLALVLFLGASAAAQPVRPSPTARPLVLRSEVELVQVDAVVTDGEGHHVSDLRAEDFEIVEDGKIHPATHAEFVEIARDATPVPGASEPPRRPAPPKRDSVQRTLALVVDDLGLSFEVLHHVRQGLTTFVDAQMGPSDLVAIVRTGGPIGLLQQLTNDKAQLKAAIAQLQYNTSASQARSAREEASVQGCAPYCIALMAMRRQRHIADTMTALESVADTLVSLPGRKSMIVVSERLSLRDETMAPVEDTSQEGARQAPPGREIDSMLVDQMRRLIERANRSAVVIHTIHPFNPSREMKKSRESRQEISEDQSGLQNIADDTGGTFHPSVMNIPTAVTRIMHELRGYYRLGYSPSAQAVNKKGERTRYHELKVRVKRAGLKVRSRKGYLAANEEDRKAALAAQTPTTTTVAAVSPFALPDLGVRLAAAFSHDTAGAGVLRTFVHVGRGAVTFASQPDGTQKAELEVRALVIGENGTIAGEAARSVLVPASRDTADRMMRGGAFLELSFPIKTPGPYQIRAAVTDVLSKKMGTASRFLIVPDVGKRRLALSGLLLSGTPCGDGPVLAGVLRVCSGAELLYGLTVYQAQVAKDGKPRLQTRLRLLREGQPVHEGVEQAIATTLVEGAGKDVIAFSANGSHALASAAPGEYTLEITVKDTLAKKESVVTESVDFEVIP